MKLHGLVSVYLTGVETTAQYHTLMLRNLVIALGSQNHSASQRQTKACLGRVCEHQESPFALSSYLLKMKLVVSDSNVWRTKFFVYNSGFQFGFGIFLILILIFYLFIYFCDYCLNLALCQTLHTRYL